MKTIFDEADYLDRHIVKPTLDIFNDPTLYELKDRVGQSDMALDIAEAIRDKQNIMVEAGVGIGKSLGYLIPGIFAAKTLKGPIVIATSSIALSEQLMKDAYWAQKITGIQVKPVLAKGATNYICKKRISESQSLIKEWRKNPKAVPSFDQRLLDVPEDVWNIAFSCKDRVSLPVKVSNVTWNFIHAQRCSLASCEFKGQCEFAQMRQSIGKYGNADIIIANQDLYLANQINERDTGNFFINDRKKILIIDEAHNLETKTRSALTEQWTQGKMLQAFIAIDRPLNRIQAPEKYFSFYEKTKVLIPSLFQSFQRKMTTMVQQDIEQREAVRYPIYEKLKPDKITLWANILEEIADILTFSTSRYGQSSAFEDIINKFSKMKDAAEIFASFLRGESEYLCWTEGNYRNASQIKLCMAPKDINLQLERLLFNYMQIPVIMTSATLCNQNSSLSPSYDYMKQTTGFIGEVSPPKPSPFPYDTNALLYIANDLADPSENREEFLKQAVERIYELVSITNGRTLLLFTAKTDLSEVYRAIEKRNLPWKLHRQLDGGAQGTTSQKFIDSGGILFSTGFWEGFNIPGPALSSVIIVRLPFPVPDPVINYKISRVKNRMDVLVPEMLIKLRQGSGRLIRDDSDTGIVTILDPRASEKANKPYRSDILNALPIKKVTESLEIVSTFAKEKIPNIL